LDEELASITASLTTSEPMPFNYSEALSGMGNGWRGGTPFVDEGYGRMRADAYADYGIEEEYEGEYVEDGRESREFVGE
jgi:hypothetical protein